MNILLTGGAGYIGSITAHKLSASGNQVVILDTLENGKQDRVAKFPLIKAPTYDQTAVEQCLKEHKIDAVIHFAAYIEAGESMHNPGKYFYNNTTGSERLFSAMVNVGVDKLVFSSTAAVYGIPAETPIDESFPTNPINPYGESKLMVEKMLSWFANAHDLNYIAIRYFNACGGLLDGSLGEDHQPETHLIPNVIKAALTNQEFTLYGDDYQTYDGTCIRDYIHVIDLANAHIKALDALVAGAKSDIVNAGIGAGYSNLEIIEMVEQISGQKINYKIGDRRAGDPDMLIAENKKLTEDYDWQPHHSDLETIISSAWRWHKQQLSQ